MASMSNKLFCDANLLLEVMDERSRVQVVRKFLQNTPDGLFISSLTGHLVMHFGRQRASVVALRALLSDFTMLPLTQADFDWAYTNARNDNFEDALQLAVAIRGGCDTFATFDRRLYQQYRNLPQLKVQLLGDG